MPNQPAERRNPRKKQPPRVPARTDWQDGFLAQLALHGIAAWAAKASSVSVDTVDRERKRNPPFGDAYDQAKEESTAALERRAVQWATGGIPTRKTVTRTRTWQQRDRETGELVTLSETNESVEEGIDLSPAMLIFLLKSRRPAVYRDYLRVEQTGADGGPVEHSIATREERDRAVGAFDAAVVRLADRRRPTEGAAGSGQG